MKLSLKRNLVIGFGISLLLLIISSIASMLSINSLLSSSTWVAHTNQVVERLEQTLSVVKDAETGQRGYLITGKLAYLEPYNGSYQRAKGFIADIRTLTADNSDQQETIGKLDQLLSRRFWKLQDIMDKKKLTGVVDMNDMEEGRLFMDSVRLEVQDMITHEKYLLKDRTATLSQFTAYTPVIIISAAVLAIIITIFFYTKTNRDIDERIRLEEELARKDESIRSRLRVIQNISEKISAGDYTVRVTDTVEDELGNISVALNKMTSSLQRSFNALSEKEWLQAGLAGLSESVIAEDHLQEIAKNVLAYAASYSGSQVGAFYVQEPTGTLTLQHSIALEHDLIKKQLQEGEGLPGHCAQLKKQVLITGISDDNFNISFTSATIKPVNIIVFPLLFENTVKGVIEMGALHAYTDRELEFFNNISGNIGTAVNMAQSRQRVQELLKETQAQSEELMTQQEELEQINSELEAQSQQLQTSEEELKVQSEELIETNTLLEERSSALEQRNQLIQQKNSEIEKKAKDLELSTRYKSEFLANMSHELRTPLNSILLLSRLMSENMEKNLSAEQVQYAQVIQSSGNGLLQLIDEILDLSKIESGKMTVENLLVRVNEITGNMQSLFEPVAKQQQLQWVVSIGADVPETMETDRLRLEQVLKNLLSNAFKFTAQGAVRLTLSCPADRPGYICFAVKDSGIGISPDKQALIFEAFQQEDGSTRRKFGGTGLGLSISRELAKLLGGEITLSSTPGDGSEFVCSIPLVPAMRLPVGRQAEPPEQIVPVEIPVTESPVSETALHAVVIPDEIADDRNTIQTGDKVILIIEDDVNFASALLDYTRQKGYKGVVAVRGDKGIEMAAKHSPAGILLDIQLPVKNGWEVMDALKANVHTRHIPVHVMSSLPAKNESIVKGAVDFINKPVAFEQLNTIFEKIEFILGKKENHVLIIEENYKHAKALAYYLGTNSVTSVINQTVEDSIASLRKKELNCVILDISAMSNNLDKVLERIRSEEGFEALPVILFTGKSLSAPEEFRLKQFADAIVLKTANSYKRILDEVSLFLHLVQEQVSKPGQQNFERNILQENVLKGKKVLLADDDVRNIFSMTKTLEKYQMSVIPAMDGKEALRLVKSNAVDVVLMDMMMPEMDGYESIRAIRGIPQFRNLPVIAVTAKAMTEDREKCIAAGASDYISKPVDMDQLVSLLRIWLYEKGY